MLINGTDPQSQIEFGKDSVLNSAYNTELLNKVSFILEYILKIGMEPSVVDKRKKFNFYLTDSQKQQIRVSEEPISISKFVYIINELIDISSMKKLPATAVTKWLTKNGYLKSIINDDYFSFKDLTEKSFEIGLSSQERINKYGNKYSVILYPPNAQKFIIDNLNEIISSYYGFSDIVIEK